MNIFLTFMLLGMSVLITKTTDPGMQMRLTDHAINYGKFKTFLHCTVTVLCIICISQFAYIQPYRDLEKTKR